MNFMRFKQVRTGELLVLNTIDVVSVSPLLHGSRITLRGGAIHDVQDAFAAVTRVLMPDAPAEKAPEKTPRQEPK